MFSFPRRKRREQADALAKAQAQLETVRHTLARATKEREKYLTFILAARREGLLPQGAWTRYANCCGPDLNERDSEKACASADALRARLGRDSRPPLAV